MARILQKHIFPAIHKESQPLPSSQNSTSHSQLSNASEEHGNSRSVFTADGDVPQINAMLKDKVVQLMKKLNIDGLKFSAACSLSQQPNDLHRGFPNLNRSLDKLSQNYENLEQCRQPSYMKDLKRKLKDYSSLQPHQVEMVLKFFEHAPDIFTTALSPAVVRKGFKMAGLAPYSCETILNNCSEWKDFTLKDATATLKGIEQLVEFGMKHGWVTEEQMDSMGIPPSPQKCTDMDTSQMTASEAALAKQNKRRTKPLNELMESRQRALWINSEATIARRRDREDAKRRLAEEKAQREADRVQAQKDKALALEIKATEKEEARLEREQAKKDAAKLAEDRKKQREVDMAAKEEAKAASKLEKVQERESARKRKLQAAEEAKKETMRNRKVARIQVVLQSRGKRSKKENATSQKSSKAAKRDDSDKCANCYSRFSKKSSKAGLWRGCEHCDKWWCGACAANIDAHERGCFARQSK